MIILGFYKAYSLENVFAQPSKTLSPHPPGVSAGFSLIEVGLTLTIIAALASTGILGWNDFSENSNINSVRVVRAALQTTIAQSIDAFETPTTAMPAANLLNQLRANSLLQNGVVITPLGANVSDGFTVTINNNGVSTANLTVAANGSTRVSEITGFSDVTVDELNQ